MKCERKVLFLSGPFVFTAMVLLTFCLAPFAFGKVEKKNLPDRGISAYPEYTGVIVSRGDDVSIDLILTNFGRRDENINIEVTSIPGGWKAWIKTYSYGVTGAHVKSDTSRNLSFRARPDETVAPGRYRFDIKARTEDRQFTSLSHLFITVEEKKEEKKPEGVKIVTSYPVLKGPTDAEFEFSLEVENKLDGEGIFNLTAVGPKDWDINFKPAYEEKFISSLRLKANQSQSVAVEVKPHPLSEPGEYPILVKVSSPEVKGDVKLAVVLTGTYKLDVGTANGLLSLNVLKGKDAVLSFYVKNSGSAPLNDIHFFSFKPENWKVDFSPERIDSMAPEELQQIEVSITPAGQALVGDYSVSLSAESGRISEAMELRVTVRASTAWAFVGIGIIVLVVAGLFGLFFRLGRR